MGVVVRSRREQVAGVAPRAPAHRVPGTASATMLELQRTAGNKALGQLVSRAGSPLPVVPVVQRRKAPKGEYGLDAPAREGVYATVAVTLWRTQKDLGLKEFAEKLVTHVVDALRHPGIPDVTSSWATLGAPGRFSSQRWMIDLDLAAFKPNASASSKVRDLSFAQVKEIIGTIYHEARHADQNILVIRRLLDAKVPARDIAAQTTIRGDVVYAVRKATFQEPLDAEERAHATRMFDVMYGSHNQVLAFLIINTPALEGIERLGAAGSDLVAADPHVTTFVRWQSSVLQPKVDAMKKATTLTKTEQDLFAQLDLLNSDVLDLADAWNAIPDKKRPSTTAAAAARSAAGAAHTSMQAAYVALESEADAFRVEAEVKAAFEAGDRAWKLSPAPGNPNRKKK
jgi:hypothetical protein